MRQTMSPARTSSPMGGTKKGKPDPITGLASLVKKKDRLKPAQTVEYLKEFLDVA